MLLSVVAVSLFPLGKAGRNTVRAEICLSGKKDVTFHKLKMAQGRFATTTP